MREKQKHKCPLCLKWREEDEFIGDWCDRCEEWIREGDDPELRIEGQVITGQCRVGR